MNLTHFPKDRVPQISVYSSDYIMDDARFELGKLIALQRLQAKVLSITPMTILYPFYFFSKSLQAILLVQYPNWIILLSYLYIDTSTEK